MTGFVRSTVRLLMVGGVLYRLRSRLVHLLTRTTGTWVGSPDA